MARPRRGGRTWFCAWAIRPRRRRRRLRPARSSTSTASAATTSGCRTAGLDLDAADTDHIGPAAECLGAGGPQAAGARHAAGRCAAAGRCRLRRPRRLPGGRARPPRTCRPRVPAAPTRSAASTAPNTRTRIRDLLALDVDVTALLPRDDASYGFDNVGAVNLSPALLERYLSAARKGEPAGGRQPAAGAGEPGGGVACGPHAGRPLRRPAVRHARAVRLSTTTSRSTASTRSRCGCPRNRNENVEGLTEPHELELTLDGERLRVFEIVPNRNELHGYYADEDVDKGLLVRLSVDAGPHVVGAGVPQEELRADRDRAAAVRRALQHGPPPAHAAGRALGGDCRSVRGDGGPATRRAAARIFVCRPVAAAEESACAGDDHREPGPPRLSPARERRGFSPRRWRSTSGVGRTAASRDGIELALRALLTSTEFLFRIERDPDGLASGAALSPERRRARLAPLLLSLEQPAGRRAARPCRARGAERARGAGGAGRPDARRCARGIAGDELRGPVGCTCATWRRRGRTCGAIPDFDDNLRRAFRRETELLFRERRQRGPRRARSPAGPTTRSSTSGSPGTTTSPASTATTSGEWRSDPGSPARRAARPRQRPDRHVVQRRARRRCCAASGYSRTCWACRPRRPRPTCRRSTRTATAAAGPADAGAHGAAPGESGVRCLPPAHGSGGLAMENFDAIGRWRERDAARRPINVSGSLPGRTRVRGASAVSGRRCWPARSCFVRTDDREAADVRPRPRAWGEIMPMPRPYGRYCGEAARNDNRFSSLVLAVRREHAVPDAEVAMIVKKLALPRRTFLRGLGATVTLAAARRHGTGAHRAGADGRGAGSAGWDTSSFRWG